MRRGLGLQSTAMGLHTHSRHRMVVITHRSYFSSFSFISGPDFTTTTTPFVPVSSFSSALTQKSPIYNPWGVSNTFYYEAIRIVVSVSGSYMLKSVSNIDTAGFLYVNCFDPNNITTNLLASDNDNGGSLQFLISATLQPATTYILVVTTTSSNVIGAFSIGAAGGDSVALQGLEILGTDPCRPPQPPSTTTVKYTPRTTPSAITSKSMRST